MTSQNNQALHGDKLSLLFQLRHQNAKRYPSPHRSHEAITAEKYPKKAVIEDTVKKCGLLLRRQKETRDNTIEYDADSMGKAIGKSAYKRFKKGVMT